MVAVAAVSQLEVHSNGSAALLTWEPPPLLASTCVRGYQVCWHPRDSPSRPECFLQAAETHVFQRPACELYLASVRIAGVDNSISGATSVRLDFATPGEARDVSVLRHSSDWVEVVWQPPLLNADCVSGYEVCVSTAAPAGNATCERTGATTLNVTALQPGGVYVVAVEALGPAGARSAAATVAAVTDRKFHRSYDGFTITRLPDETAPTPTKIFRQPIRSNVTPTKSQPRQPDKSCSWSIDDLERSSIVYLSVPPAYVLTCTLTSIRRVQLATMEEKLFHMLKLNKKCECCFAGPCFPVCACCLVLRQWWRANDSGTQEHFGVGSLLVDSSSCLLCGELMVSAALPDRVSLSVLVACFFVSGGGLMTAGPRNTLCCFAGPCFPVCACCLFLRQWWRANDSGTQEHFGVGSLLVDSSSCLLCCELVVSAALPDRVALSVLVACFFVSGGGLMTAGPRNTLDVDAVEGLACVGLTGPTDVQRDVLSSCRCQRRVSPGDHVERHQRAGWLRGAAAGTVSRGLTSHPGCDVSTVAASWRRLATARAYSVASSRCRNCTAQTKAPEGNAVIDFVGGSGPAAPILADQQAHPADVRRGARQTHPRRSEAFQPHPSLLDTRSRRFPFRWSLLSLLVFYRSELSHSLTYQLLGLEACYTFISFALTIWKVQRTPSHAERIMSHSRPTHAVQLITACLHTERISSVQRARARACAIWTTTLDALLSRNKQQPTAVGRQHIVVDFGQTSSTVAAVGSRSGTTGLVVLSWSRPSGVWIQDGREPPSPQDCIGPTPGLNTFPWRVCFHNSRAGSPRSRHSALSHVACQPCLLVTTPIWRERTARFRLFEFIRCVSGATVAERLARLPPTKTNWAQSLAGSPDLASGNHAGRCCWSAGLLGDLPFPPPLHSDAAPYSLQSPSSAFKTPLLSQTRIQMIAGRLPGRITRPVVSRLIHPLPPSRGALGRDMLGMFVESFRLPLSQ
ncbi:hypothetical protein PR048_004147 [Dryococelus australis]|uniref:Fibronectin type-III domain-containing protein n=1 Tax=Dryococelus australis TaxID=614101 RepID=A0ABQ9I4N6_9NEOP|nr:hypothetical protein PR048_004147 [Dryococelus australis]